MRSVVEVIASCAPAASKPRAIANPIPAELPAPVTIAICPCKTCSMTPLDKHLLVQSHSSLNRSLHPGNPQQLRIKLHKGMLHRGILFMALPAVVLARRVCTRCFRRTSEIKVSPFVRKSRFIFYFHVQAGELRLIAAVLVDR